MEKVNKLAFLLGTTGPAGCCREAVWREMAGDK
jgi:hypothetical protein